jgi:hypothetical protein
MPTVFEKMPVHSENCWQGCPTNRWQSPKTHRRIPNHLPSLLIIFYGILKMSLGATVPDPDPELINAQNFDFAKPKLFLKNISKYAATSTYIQVRIPFNFTTIFNTKQAIAGVYDQLLEKHEEPFKSITKSITDVSLAIIEGSLEDFRDIIKALPQRTEISTPGWPKRFIALGISIAAMAMSTFNTVRITQLNEEISTLKEKTDLILDVVHLHEKYLHHMEEKLEQTNKLLADLLVANVCIGSDISIKSLKHKT